MPRTVNTVAGEFTFNDAQKLRRQVRANDPRKDENPSDPKPVKCFGRDMSYMFAFFLVEYLEQQFPLHSEDENA